MVASVCLVSFKGIARTVFWYWHTKCWVVINIFTRLIVSWFQYGRKCDNIRALFLDNKLAATLGFVATEFVHLPGDVHAVNSILAHNAAVSSGSAFQVLTAIAGLEFIACIAMKEMFDGSGRAPGDFSFDPLNLSAKSDQKQKDIMALKELENGRLAMVAFSGIVTQAVLTQHGFPYI